MMDEEAERMRVAFEEWWSAEAENAPIHPDESMNQFIKRMCAVAWTNGAYKQKVEGSKS